MIGISKLYCGTVEPSDVLRYNSHSAKLPSELLQFSKDKKPVVVWNCTKRCNLNCIHCYAKSDDRSYDNELSTSEAKGLIDQLADFGVPVLLFSGGEPLTRPDLPEIVLYARSKKLRAVISTNGTLITDENASIFAEAGVSYVGVSLDGMDRVHDHFRNKKGAFDQALRGIRACKQAGVKVGLRFTVNKLNVDQIPDIFDLVKREQIPRICFYHLVYTGRGSDLINDDLSHEQTRQTVDLIIDRTKELHDQGYPIEVLTVDNHADGVYLYLRMLKENAERSQNVLQLLKMNGGNSTGIGIGCVSWDGSVYPDQFWRHQSVGNIREQSFGAIWTDPNNSLLVNLRNRKEKLTGRCGICGWKAICNGNFRVRAEAIYNDLWAQDPACYLTDDELLMAPEE